MKKQTHTMQPGTRSTVDVNVSHPTNFHQGIHTLAIYCNRDGSYHFDNQDFGCSRDYRMSPMESLTAFMAEHACTVKSASFA